MTAREPRRRPPPQGWLECVGITGWNGSESPAGLRWNTQTRTLIACGIWVDQAASVHVAGNTILRVGLLLQVAKSRAGIVVTASDRAHVCGNEVSDVAPVGDFVGASVGIAVLTPFSGVDVSGNLARRFSPGLGVKTVDSSDWTPLLILGSPPAQAERTFIAVAGRFSETFLRTQNPIADNLASPFKLELPAKTGVSREAALTATTINVPVPVTLTPSAPITSVTGAAGATSVAGGVSGGVAPAPKAPPIRVAARGNQLEGFGSQAVALIQGQTDCVFADNHCALATPANQTINNADVLLGAQTVIASGNRITGGAVALNILVLATTACSVLGNLTLGSITVGGSGLAAPWAALNVSGS